MQIKKRLQINIAISILTALVVGFILIMSMYRLNQANDTSKIVGEIMATALERLTLRSDYINNNSSRAKEQWFAKHEMIGGILKSTSSNFRDVEDNKCFNAIIKNQESIGKIFSAIMANREMGGLNREVEERLLNQLNMRVYEVVINGRTLLESSREARASTLRQAGVGISSVLAAIIALSFFNSWSMGRAITERIRRLHEGAVVIGAGNLDHLIDLKSDDEFTDLSDAFNGMTASLRMSYNNLEREIEERKRTEGALRGSEQRYSALFANKINGMAHCRTITDEYGQPVDYILLQINEAYERILGVKKADIDGRRVTEVFPDIKKYALDYIGMYGKIALEGGEIQFEEYFEATGQYLSIYAYSPLQGEFIAIFTDVTDRREAENERQMFVEFLGFVNESYGSEELIRKATDFFKKNSGCEAVGIRLKEREDYPYFSTQGFPEEFVLLENHLCDYDELGEVIRDGNGTPLIECMCGNVICGRIDPEKPFFTPQGSFWSNCGTELLASTSDADRQARTRNRCNGEGYESVALIPFGPAEEHLGLLQLNDRRTGLFTAKKIAMWERLTAHLAAALSKFRAEESLQRTAAELAQQMEVRTRDLREKEVMLKEIHHRVKNNLQVISSLISLQAGGSKDEAVRQVLQDVTFRVRSMALVHEKLYQSADLARIDFAEYTRGLLSYLWRAHGAIAAAVRVTFDLEPVSLPTDTAVTCGLILNELAVNALEHAFPDRADGEVTVSLHSGADGRTRLCVADNGVGLPKGLDWRQSGSLGLRLVQMLSRQLDSTVAVSSECGTKFEILFDNPDGSPSLG